MKTSDVYEHPVWCGVPGKTFRPGGLALTEHALASCGLQPGSIVLDVGCGIGTTINYLVANHRLTSIGADASLELLSRARQDNPRLSLAQAIAECLPVATASVDAIFAECTLSIFADRPRVLREFARTLKRDGYLIASDVYARRTPSSNGHAVQTQTQIIEQIQAQGFCVQTWQDHSVALQQFAAQMIWASGSFDNFFRQTALAQTPNLPLAVAREHLSYYLLVARKSATENTERK